MGSSRSFSDRTILLFVIGGVIIVVSSVLGVGRVVSPVLLIFFVVFFLLFGIVFLGGRLGPLLAPLERSSGQNEGRGFNLLLCQLVIHFLLPFLGLLLLVLLLFLVLYVEGLDIRGADFPGLFILSGEAVIITPLEI